jgi:hypothetical protein
MNLPGSHSWKRREFLSTAYCGFGALAAAALDTGVAQGAGHSPLQARPAHFDPPARSVIFLFMSGGPSHVDTFDPKPLLTELNGQVRPAEFGEAKYQQIQQGAKLLASTRTFRQCGQSGIEVSDLFPHLSRVVDEIAVVRSCFGERVVHSAAQYELFSGRVIPGAPSMGSWLAYGLGSESESLPAYIVHPDPKGALEGGQPMYSNGFLPAVYQPTMLRSGPRPVRNLDLPPGVNLQTRRETIRLIQDLNGPTADFDPEYSARLGTYELAFRMQTEAPEVFDLSGETAETLQLYGVGQAPTDDYARRCLLARRLLERGVRFQVVVSGGGPGNLQWDAHSDVNENHERMAGHTDQPVAALLTDLKRRGLLDQTLVLWGGEFGRSPEAQSGNGRDHHNLGFSMWLAGGGVQGGRVVGATDAIGLRAVERPCHFRDLHATILQQLGLDQELLTWPHQGRRERLTFLSGTPLDEIL